MNRRTAGLAGVILVAALTRVLPHPPNFTAVGALALFAGARLGSRRTAFLMPLAAMLLGDAVLQVLYRLGGTSGWLGGGPGFHRGMAVVYGTLVLVTAVGLALRRSRSPLAVAGGALACSLLFFAVTNFAVWAIFFGGFALAERRLPALQPRPA